MECDSKLPAIFNDFCCGEPIKAKGILLYQESDLKRVNGVTVVKRKYGKFTREPIYIPESKFEQYGIILK